MNTRPHQVAWFVLILGHFGHLSGAKHTLCFTRTGVHGCDEYRQLKFLFFL